MKKTVFAFLLGLCIPIGGAYLFLILGGMPVATTGNPLPLERFVARTAIHKAMGSERGRPSPVQADAPNLMAGAKVYSVHCAVCHGFPHEKPSAIAQGMFPQPPQFFEPNEGVTDDPVGSIYWKVKNGIRLTGMPGFSDGLSETEMWQVSLLLLHGDDLPGEVRETLHSR